MALNCVEIKVLFVQATLLIKYFKMLFSQSCETTVTSLYTSEQTLQGDFKHLSEIVI